MGSFLSLLAVLGSVGGVLAFLFLRNRQELQRKELEIRKLEAKAKLLEPPVDDLPSYVDPRDTQAVAAWHRAKAELNQALGQGAKAL
jgi:hypothetical protein